MIYDICINQVRQKIWSFSLLGLMRLYDTVWPYQQPINDYAITNEADNKKQIKPVFLEDNFGWPTWTLSQADSQSWSA